MGVCTYGCCKVWFYVCVGFVICGCFENFVGVFVICILVFTVIRIVCTAFFIVSFIYIYFYLLLLQGLLPPSENSIAVNNNSNNNNNKYVSRNILKFQK